MPMIALLLQMEVYQILAYSSLTHSALRVWGYILALTQLLIYSSPFYLTYSNAIVSELEAMSYNTGLKAYLIVPAFAVIITIVSIVGGWQRYRKH